MTDTTVRMTDRSGNIVEMPKDRAIQEANNPEQNYVPSTNEEIGIKNTENLYGTTGQKILGAAEAVTGGPTMNIVPTAIDMVLSKYNSEVARQYKESREARAGLPSNYLLNSAATLGGYATSGLVTGTGKVAGSVLAPFVGEAATSALGRIGQGIAQGALHGAMFEGGSYVIPTLLDNEPFHSDALLQSMGKGAVTWGAFHGVIGAGTEALAQIGEAKNLMQKYIEKVSAPSPEIPSTGEPLTTSAIDKMDLKQGDSPLGVPSTEFKINNSAINENPDGTFTETYDATHSNKNKSTKINQDNITGGKIADFDSTDGLLKIGKDLGIEDLPAKYLANRIPGESLAEYIKHEKISQNNYDWLFRNEFSLTSGEQEILDAHAHNITALKQNPNDPGLQKNLQISTDVINATAQSVKNRPITDPEIANKSLIEKELQNMKYEISHSTAGKRAGFERAKAGGGVENINTSSRSTFPDWFKKSSFNSKEDFARALNPKNKGYAEAIEIAKDRLNNGYSNIHSGDVPPDEGYIRETLNIPNSEKEYIDSKNESVSRNYSEYVKTLDHAKIDGSLHVLNNDYLNGNLVETTSNPQYSENAKSLLGEVNIKEKTLKSIPVDTFNKVTEYIRNELSPKSDADLNPGEHKVDYMERINNQNLLNTKDTLERVYDRATNIMNKAGISTEITNMDIARFVEQKILPEYIDPKTGNPYPGKTQQASAIKEYANQYKETNYINGKLGREYPNLTPSELRMESIRVGKMGYQGEADTPVVADGAKLLRDHLEAQIISRIKSVSPEIAKAYESAKYDSHMALQARDILGAAGLKAASKIAGKQGNALGMILGSKIGGGIGRSIGIPGGGVVGTAIGARLGGGIAMGGEALSMLNSTASNVKGAIATVLGNSFKQYDSMLNQAAKGILIDKDIKYQPTRTSGKTYNDIKKDQKKIEATSESQAQYINDIMDRNKFLNDMIPNTTSSAMQTIVKANKFLMSKIPQNPYKGIPWREDKWEPSQPEIDKFYRYQEAVSKPGAILKQLNEGYITPEGVEVLSVLYPATKEELKSRIMGNMKSELSTEKQTTLFKLFGVPLNGYTSGALFQKMQTGATNAVMQNLQQNKPINTSKVGDSMKNLSQGSQTIREQS